MREKELEKIVLETDMPERLYLQARGDPDKLNPGEEEIVEEAKLIWSHLTSLKPHIDQMALQEKILNVVRAF